MTRGELLDATYGDDLDKMMDDIRKHGRFVELHSDDYPTIF